MNKKQRRMALPLSFALLLVSLVVAPSAGARGDAVSGATVTPQQIGVLERGYRTGYSDGYQAGWRDVAERAARDHRSNPDYVRADRVYVAAYGSLEDYRDGYRQGFEAGYESGYDQRGFNPDIPAGLARRGVSNIGAGVGIDDATRTPDDSNTRVNTARDIITIPSDTTLRVELLNRLTTDVSRRGDNFEARVLDPREYEGAVVSGRVTRVRRPGKVRGDAELQLSFDQIRLADGRVSNFNAQVVEVIQAGDREGVGEVDPEGGVRGRSSTKDDVAKVGAGAGIGAIIGAIAGGGKGAAIGAAIGGAVGTGGVLTSRGRDIRLEPGQQIMIRTGSETRIQ